MQRVLEVAFGKENGDAEVWWGECVIEKPRHYLLLTARALCLVCFAPCSQSRSTSRFRIAVKRHEIIPLHASCKSRDVLLAHSLTASCEAVLAPAGRTGQHSASVCCCIFPPKWLNL